MTKGKHDTDRISAIFIFVFSAIFLWQLRYIHSPLDVIFPRTILIGMMLLSVVLFIKSFMRPDPKSVKALLDIKNREKVIMGIIGTVLWLILIPIIGFVITSVIALIVLSTVLGVKSDRTPFKLISAVLIASVTVFIIYYFFSGLMEVQLPKGALF